MKSKYYIFLTLFLLTCTAFVGKAEKFTTSMLDGKIGKYPVYMELTIDSGRGTVYGWYYYKSKGPNNKISLSGTCKDGRAHRVDYIINLKESVNGKVTGSFSGDFVQGHVQGIGWIENYQGTWTSPKGTKLKFNIGD